MSDPIRFDVTLPADPAPGPDVVTRAGKVFAVGQYVDRDFALSEAEADAAIAAFRPVAADLEHMPTVLDGKLGQLTRVWREGADLFGAVAVPTWLDPLLAETGRKVSLAWDRATKQIVGWGWVRSPRITDAALYAAFTGARHNQSDQRALNAAHDAIVHAGADNCPAQPPKEARMSFMEKVRAWLDAGAPATFDEGDEQPPTPPTPAPVPTPAPTPPPPPPANPEVFALQARLAQVEGERRAEQATTFTAGLVTAGRILPAARPALEALYAQALADDAAHAATVTFNDTLAQAHTGTRAATLAAFCAALPPAPFGSERIPAGSYPLPATPPPDADADAKRLAALLNMTPMGQVAQHTNGKEH